ncbi:cation/H(+) antiporter 4-like [Argentina anserina]|uniref:cation/H(+) antiporter 4-like n=1 Tax=Argentina anserina TaxID=57926 RepID=UPI002176799F|nr:cation/H(+) antiporter 4-like [Potentilla anserina]
MGIKPKEELYGLASSLPMLELQMAMIFITSQLLYLLFKRFHISKFTSHLFTGILIGILYHYWGLGEKAFSVNSQEVISTLGELGYGLFLFALGTTMDLGMIRRSGHKAVLTGVICMLVPLASGDVAERLFEKYFYSSEMRSSEDNHLELVTATHSITAFPVVVLLLQDLQLLNSEIGRLSQSATLICDVFSVCIQYFIGKSISKWKEDDKNYYIGLAIAYVISVAVIFRPIMLWIVRHTPENRPVKKSYLSALFLVVLVSGILSHNYGQAFHFGPFIFGLAVPAGRPLGSAVQEKFQLFISDVFLPIYVTINAIRADFWLIDYKDVVTKATVILMVFVFAVKILATMAAQLYLGMPLKDAFVLALILSCKGIVHLAAYTKFRDTGFVNDSAYAVMFSSVVVTSILVPIIVKHLYDPSRKYAGYERRDIMHLKPNAEFKILTCIHRSSNMPAVINLLDAACPSTENPINVYVLHLIELMGRVTPIFVSHQVQDKTDSHVSTYSANVILYFNQFMSENRGAVDLSVFTAISPPKFMQEEICTLAMDKVTSLIVLPFHRQWSIDGSSIESEDNTIRSVNFSVLEAAPCSVGILVDRGHLGQSTSVVSTPSTFSVAVVFLGGKDDREALAFAKRMAKDSTIRLTIIHLVAMGNEHGGGEWDKILDVEALKEFKYNHLGGGLVVYIEEMVKDGPETAFLLRSMVDEYDIIILGRRHNVESPQTVGLSQWSEFQELGTIGDLLASPDLDCKASILVMQQQRWIS